MCKNTDYSTISFNDAVHILYFKYRLRFTTVLVLFIPVQILF